MVVIVEVRFFVGFSPHLRVKTRKTCPSEQITGVAFLWYGEQCKYIRRSVTMKGKINNHSAEPTFTDRQLDVLICWSELAGEAAIAEKLGMSVHTVHTHLRRMRHKLGVKRTFDVYKYAQKEGLLKSSES